MSPSAAAAGRNPSPMFIGVLEDDPVMGGSLAQRLRLEGYEPLWWRSGEEAIAAISSKAPDLFVCDIRLPDMNGEDVFNAVLPHLGGTPTVFVTGFGEIDQAVRLMRNGADEYITKPFEMDDFLNRLSRLAARQLSPRFTTRASLGVSSQMQGIENTLQKIADIDSTVLFVGESGSGKEVAARYLHQVSDRRDKPFVAVNCAAIPAELMESELFGHERGSFTGAADRHRGYAERSADGVLFLDEVGDLPLMLQGKILHLIQERQFARVGGERQLPFSARIMCATNVDLDAAVATGQFREDLFYRINVIPVTIPPLRDRPADIMPLVQGFVLHFAESLGRNVRKISAAAEEAVAAHDWPGNVRELRNRVERAVALADGSRLHAWDLFPDAATDGFKDEIPTLRQVAEAAERRHIVRTLEHSDGHMTAAAETLGISRTTLWEKMKRYGLPE